jgi:F-type H+-transporting ATPase subunit gamma
MRGIAAARAQMARNQVNAVDSHSATITQAIGRTLSMMPSERARTKGGSQAVLLLFCAEQGFVGAFNNRIFEAAHPHLNGSKLFLVGSRGLSLARQQNIEAAWNAPMPSRSQSIPKLADRIIRELYQRMTQSPIDQLNVIFSQWRSAEGMQAQYQPLFPLDLADFPSSGSAPLLNLAPAQLLTGLTADYLHARICRAALHAFAAENEARMQAMTHARDQVKRQLAQLQTTLNIVRQEAITAEIIELAAGESAAMGRESDGASPAVHA